MSPLIHRFATSILGVFIIIAGAAMYQINQKRKKDSCILPSPTPVSFSPPSELFFQVLFLVKNFHSCLNSYDGAGREGKDTQDN